MIREDWFPTPVYYMDLDLQDIDYNLVVKECYRYKKEDEGRTLSNVGGWQSNNIVFNKKYKNLNKLKSVVEDKIELVYEDYGVKESIEIKTDNAWININSNKDYNLSHNHPGVCMSAVYYAKTPNNCGRFIINNDPKINFFNNMCSNEDTKTSYSAVHYDPIPNRLLVFPAWVTHYVEPNLSNEDRISIAFNIGKL